MTSWPAMLAPTARLWARARRRSGQCETIRLGAWPVEPEDVVLPSHVLVEQGTGGDLQHQVRQLAHLGVADAPDDVVRRDLARVGQAGGLHQVTNGVQRA